MEIFRIFEMYLKTKTNYIIENEINLLEQEAFKGINIEIDGKVYEQHEDEEVGVYYYEFENVNGKPMVVYATPYWENDNSVPINICSENGEDIIMFDYEFKFPLEKRTLEYKMVIEVIIKNHIN